jgi:hypothetical protein
VLQAQGRRRFDGIAGSGHRRLVEDNDAAGPGTVWVIGVARSGMACGAHRHRLGENKVVAGLGTAT